LIKKVIRFASRVLLTVVVAILIPKESNTAAPLLTMVSQSLVPVRIVFMAGQFISNLTSASDFFLRPPRDSDAFKNMMKRHTTVECSHKRIFLDYNIEAGRCRFSRERFMRATMAAVNVHLDAWVKHRQFSVISLLNNPVAA
jgi:hypothetical protein